MKKLTTLCSWIMILSLACPLVAYEDTLCSNPSRYDDCSPCDDFSTYDTCNYCEEATLYNAPCNTSCAPCNSCGSANLTTCPSCGVNSACNACNTCPSCGYTSNSYNGNVSYNGPSAVSDYYEGESRDARCPYYFPNTCPNIPPDCTNEGHYNDALTAGGVMETCNDGPWRNRYGTWCDNYGWGNRNGWGHRNGWQCRNGYYRNRCYRRACSPNSCYPYNCNSCCYCDPSDCSDPPSCNGCCDPSDCCDPPTCKPCRPRCCNYDPYGNIGAHGAAVAAHSGYFSSITSATIYAGVAAVAILTVIAALISTSSNAHSTD